jgi:hypothetical protein
MKRFEKEIARAEVLATELHELLGQLVEQSRDYDVERLLKRSEAELMDLRHNLSLVERLLQDSE